jgi:hypothetical protein
MIQHAASQPCAAEDSAMSIHHQAHAGNSEIDMVHCISGAPFSGPQSLTRIMSNQIISEVEAQPRFELCHHFMITWTEGNFC